MGGPLDLFDVKSGTWEEGIVGGGETPEVRSVHGFLPLGGDDLVTPDGAKVVAVMFMGEREGAPAELGHDGAGAVRPASSSPPLPSASLTLRCQFHADAWTLASSGSKFDWAKLPVANGSETPEARGWFASGAFGADKVVVHGGLNEKNERLDDMWMLEVVSQK